MRTIIPIVSIEAQRARLADPDARKKAHERADIIHERIHARRLTQAALYARLKGARSFTARVNLFRQICAVVEEEAKDIVPCKTGCAHCCNQPVMIDEHEAKVIAAETGAKLHKPARYVTEREETYINAPCPFLKENRCSIYASRPIACRIYYVVDGDDLMCHQQNEPVTTWQLSTARDYSMKWIQTFETLPKLADLRDFFPKGLK